MYRCDDDLLLTNRQGKRRASSLSGRRANGRDRWRLVENNRKKMGRGREMVLFRKLAFVTCFWGCSRFHGNGVRLLVRKDEDGDRMGTRAGAR